MERAENAFQELLLKYTESPFVNKAREKVDSIEKRTSLP
jgi:outer membrane protein assembly factor BamD (BamD/ComL family)